MRRGIRKYRRDFVAIAMIGLLALAVAGTILSHQRFYLPHWVPVVGTDFFDLKAELSTAQAVVPGQGQSVNIAGVKVGEVGSVKLENGRAVVDMKLRRKYTPVYRDATILLRPKTGLKDMVLALDPGNRRAGELHEGDRIGVGNTLPDVNPDEILASLDGDTRAYLRILLGAGAEAFRAPDPKTGETAAASLRETFKRFAPTARDARKITALLGKRRQNVRRVIHNFQELATAVGSKDTQLAALVDSANANFQALANQEGSLRESLRLLPGTLGQTKTTLTKASDLAANLGPALQKLRPGARALGPSLRATRPFLRETTPVIRTQLRPFARAVRPTVRDLRRTAVRVKGTTPGLLRTNKFLNKAFNTLAYNPAGSEEGYLFWASWGSHLGATLFSAQDAHGPIRRGIFLASCPALSILDQIAATTPQLDVLIQLLGAPKTATVCPDALTASKQKASR